MAEVVIDIIGKDDYSSVLGNFGNIMTGIKSTIDLVTGAFNAVAGAVTPFINSAVESENAIANLDATLKSTGNAVGLTSQQLQDMASGFQEVTKFSDETIINGEAMLLTFTNIGGDVFPMATEAMLNLAEKFGSVDSASVQLGKALNDPIAGITALSRVGVSFSEQQKEQIADFMAVNDIAGAQGVILAELEKEFGGLAVAMGDTFAGKVEIFKNQLDSIKETIGAALLPLLSQWLDKFAEFLPTLEIFAGKIANVLSSIADSGLFSAETKEAILGGIFGVDSLPELLANIDQFIANIVNGLATSINNWANSGGPQELSNKLSTWISHIGEGPLAQSQALTALGNLLNALVNAAAQVDWGKIGAAIWARLGPALDKMEVNGTNSVRNFFDGIEIAITDAVRGWFDNIEIDVTSWIRDKIVNPIKAFLGIASPSTVFAEMGKNIVLGLWNGIESLVGWITDKIKVFIAGIIAPFKPLLDLLGVDTSFLNVSTSTGSIGGGTGYIPGGSTSTGTPSTGAAGTVVNQYFAGASIYVGSWDTISYECISPNPFIGATSNQLTGTTGGGVPSGHTTTS